MAEILITGAAGFIGSHLAERLLAEGHTVTGLDNFDPFYDRAVKERNMEACLANPSFRFLEMDITDRPAFRKLDQRFDSVIHLAAKAGVRPSIQDPDAYLKVNVEGTQNIVNWMAGGAAEKMLFAGSSSVYGNNKTIPFSETDPVDFPISPYAYTKKACELLLHCYHHIYNLSVISLRFFTVYGPRQRPDLAIHKFTRMIREGRPITMFGDGGTSRDYTFVQDTVDGIVRALEFIQGSERPLFEIINLGNNKPVKLSTLIEALFIANGRRVPIEQLEMQPGDVDITFANIDKATELLGYSPSTELSEGLKAFTAWYEKQNG